ncbi:DoxX family membrane protein [Niabella insulamsoli]|uniref:DoxX family membrane protein n=1 Tax=Niabella insulamsoli TaxID=3144874 RepID=UPI0031FC93BB
MKVVKFILSLLFGLMFINSGLNKHFNYMPAPEMTEEQMKIFGAFMQITWLMPLVAVVEIVGGLLFIFPKTRALGAIVILPVMVGIVLHHAVMDPGTLAIPLVLFAINLWMIFDNWKKYQALVS